MINEFCGVHLPAAISIDLSCIIFQSCQLHLIMVSLLCFILWNCNVYFYEDLEEVEIMFVENEFEYLMTISDM